MNHYLSLHLESAADAVKQLYRQPVGTLLILLMLAVAMTLPLTLYLGVQSAQAVLGKLNESPQITLYMELNADAGDTEAVQTLLAKDARIAKSEFIGKNKGLEELQTSMGGQDLVSMLDENPLPDVFIVTPDPATPPAEMEDFEKRFGTAADGGKCRFGYRMDADAVPNQRLSAQNLLVFGRYPERGIRFGGAQHHPLADFEPQRRNRNHQTSGRARFVYPPPLPLSGRVAGYFGIGREPGFVCLAG